MRTGVIVYIAGNDHSGKNADFKKAARKLAPRADMVEVISKTTGCFDINDAWWTLTTRGMQRIVCKMAELTDMGEIRFTGSELQLQG